MATSFTTDAKVVVVGGVERVMIRDSFPAPSVSGTAFLRGIQKGEIP